MIQGWSNARARKIFILIKLMQFMKYKKIVEPIVVNETIGKVTGKEYTITDIQIAFVLISKHKEYLRKPFKAQ